MFPDVDLDFDQYYQEVVASQQKLGKSFLFDFINNEFVLKDGKFIEVTDTESIKIWIEKCIRTEKDRFEIYTGTNYGVPLEELIRKQRFQFSFLRSELEREIKEALILHPLITDVINFELKKGVEMWEVHFGVITSISEEVTEVNFNV